MSKESRVPRVTVSDGERTREQDVELPHGRLVRFGPNGETLEVIAVPGTLVRIDPATDPETEYSRTRSPSWAKPLAPARPLDQMPSAADVPWEFVSEPVGEDEE
jgi:hypothetical protein